MHHSLVLDGGVLVNVYLSRQGPSILAAYPAPCVTSPAVLGERVPLLDRPGTLVALSEALDGYPLSPQTIDMAGLEARFLEWAADVPGDTARVLAFAEHAGHAVASDDARVRASVEALKADLELVSTEELLFGWHRNARPPDGLAAATLAAIEQNAYHTPSGNGPAATWWREMARRARR